MSISEEAKSFLAEKGYDEKYGARPLRRTIQRHVEDELAELVLRGQFSDGGSVMIDYDPETKSLTFTQPGEEEVKAIPETVAEETVEPTEPAPKKKKSSAKDKE